MRSGLMDTTRVRRQLLTLESLRVLVNIEICVYTECHGVQVRRIFVTEPDAFGCNWQIEWPIVHAAMAEPCRTQLRTVIEQIQERYNVAH
jgi:hypothetical protein